MPSSPVIPHNDPTLLFINAGMNQFKDVFTGTQKLDYNRATSTQKCIRAGGKHNDLDNVGFTARHHTFFEMLGNFSFGDYFKEEAIHFAWEWITKELKLPVDRLYATVYETDNDAFKLWEKIASPLKNGRVMRFGKKDNYWSMGSVGPCGPSSELHFDRGPEFGAGPNDVVNGDSDRYMEIWNLVFMQNDQLPDGKVVPLPKPSVDTGAGLERLASIMQNVNTNYGIDIFQQLVGAISDITSSKYADHVASHHVIADHVRALTFAIADGAGISNEGQGYVLRRILRRAARHGRLLGMEEPFIHKLIPVLVNEMGEAFPEIVEREKHVVKVVQAEEEAFCRTLCTGLDLFEKVASKVKSAGGGVVPGEEVFRLYDTYGFPYDLTEIIANEQELTLDEEGFQKAMAQQKEQSRASACFAGGVEFTSMKKHLEALEQSGLPEHQKTEFVRDQLHTESIILTGTFSPFPSVAVVLDRTPFYVESGGQLGDAGRIICGSVEIDVTSVCDYQGHIVHFGTVTKGTADDFTGCTSVTALVDVDRRLDIMRNHTATHLTHAALREVLGDHIKQSGSYVGPDRLRFDFSHHQPMTAEEIAEVESIVNNEILSATEVVTAEMDANAAIESGATALFGEKYGDVVRVVSIADFSKELCGGTHIINTSQIGPFFLTVETGVASGVRRLEAITGREALANMASLAEFRRRAASVIGRPESDVLEGVRQLHTNHTALQKELKKIKAEMFSGSKTSVGDEQKIGSPTRGSVALGSVTLITHDFGETDRDIMSGWIDSQKERNEPVVGVALGTVGDKVTIIVSASSVAVKDQKVHVGNLAKAVLPKFGGRGGGKPSFAQGSIAPGTVWTDLVGAVKDYLEGEDE